MKAPCTNCNLTVTVDGGLCSECGCLFDFDLIRDEADHLCPNCGRLVGEAEFDSALCLGCGQDLPDP